MKGAALQARLRGENEKGTRACRRLRQSGMVPANLYGAEKSKTRGEKTKLTNMELAISAYDLLQVIAHNQNVVEVRVGDAKKELALIKEVQRDVFGDDVVHVDMEMIDVTQRIRVTVELVIKGDAKGVKDGGKLQVDLHQLEVEALPLAIPESITVRVDDLEIGQMLHVSDIEMPEGVIAITNAEHSAVQVVAATEEEEEPTAEGGSEEPEVIGKGKGDDEDSE